jgi:hypothetical protein
MRETMSASTKPEMSSLNSPPHSARAALGSSANAFAISCSSSVGFIVRDAAWITKTSGSSRRKTPCAWFAASRPSCRAKRSQQPFREKPIHRADNVQRHLILGLQELAEGTKLLHSAASAREEETSERRFANRQFSTMCAAPHATLHLRSHSVLITAREAALTGAGCVDDLRFAIFKSRAALDRDIAFRFVSFCRS